MVFMIWKDVLNTLENQAATLFRTVVRIVGMPWPSPHGKTNGVVYDHRWLVAVDIPSWNAGDHQHNHAIIRCEKRIESTFEMLAYFGSFLESVI